MIRKMPSLWGSYSRILFLPRRGLPADGRLPRLVLSCPAVHFEARRVAAYRRVCRLDEAEAVPLLYPQIHATPLHMRLIGRSRMPIAPLGLIQLRNHVQRYQHVPLQVRVELTCRILTERRTGRGLEFDIGTEVWRDDLLLWQAITTYLCRGDYLPAGQSSDPLPPRAQWQPLSTAPEPLDSWRVPLTGGWRFARISGDFNPLHLSRLTAQAFGFPRPSAHGQWALGRSLAGRRLAERVRLDVHFEAPLFLGSRVRQEHCRQGDREQWALLSTSGEARPLLLAQLDEAPSGPLR